MQADGRADVAVRRLPRAGARQREPADHEPDRPSGGCLKSGFVDNLPQSLMVTGRLYDEATVLRVALAYERATKWHTMHPSMDNSDSPRRTTRIN